MRGLLLSLLLGMIAFTTGCPQGPSKNFPSDINANTGKTDSKSLVTNVNHYLTDAQTKYNAALTADRTDANKDAQRIRNDAIDDALAVIDDNYTDYIRNIQAHRSTGDFLLDVIELGTGAATGITKGERPNQILGIALTAFRGGRSSRELNFYQQQTTPILITKMDDNRSKILAILLDKKKTEVDEYSLKAAIRDIVAYYNAGTLVRAFTELNKDTSASAAASEALVRHVRGDVQVSDIPTEAMAQVVAQFTAQEKSLLSKIRTIELTHPIPKPAGPTPTASETAAITTAQATRTTALKPLRDKLGEIWTEIAGDSGKFDASIALLRGETDMAVILSKIDTAPDTVSPNEYMKLLRHLRTKVGTDVALNTELVGIITKNNQ